MLHTAELDMVNTVETSDIDVFITDAACAIHSNYYTVLKASPGSANFGWNVLFSISILADWNRIGDHRQCQTDLKWNVTITHAMIGTTKLVIMYFLEKMASYANQKVGMKVILGLSHQFIQVGQSGLMLNKI